MKLVSTLTAAFAMTLVATFGASAFATIRTQARIEKTYAFPISTLQKVEQAMADAHARKGAAMKEEAVYEISAEDRSVVRCASESPIVYEGHLYGCVLEYTIDLGNGATAVAGNMLYLTQSSQEVQAILDQTDAQKTSRVQFKSIFDGGYGSSFYCEAGSNPAWNCFLRMIDGRQ